MGNLEQYYTSILKKVDDLVKDKKIDQAIFVLEDELQAPYIPKDFFDLLQDKLNYLNADRKYLSNIKDYEKMNKKELLNEIVLNNQLNLFALENFIERFYKNLSNIDFLNIEEIFKNKSISNQSKAIILESFVHSKIEYVFNFFNTNLNEEILCDTAKIKLFYEIDLYKNSKLLIEELTFKDPSLNKISLDLLNMVYYYYFPIIPNIEFKELTKAIIDNILCSLEGKKIEENNLNNLIKKIILEANN